MCVTNIAEFEISHKDLHSMKALSALTNLLTPESLFQDITDYTREKAAIGIALLSYKTDTDMADVATVELHVLRLIFDELSTLLKSDNTALFGSSARQLFLALQLLAISDTNAMRIVDEGAVPLIQKTLASSSFSIWTARQVSIAIGC